MFSTCSGRPPAFSMRDTGMEELLVARMAPGAALAPISFQTFFLISRFSGTASSTRSASRIASPRSCTCRTFLAQASHWFQGMIGVTFLALRSARSFSKVWRKAPSRGSNTVTS